MSNHLRKINHAIFLHIPVKQSPKIDMNAAIFVGSHQGLCHDSAKIIQREMIAAKLMSKREPSICLIQIS